MKRLSSHPLYKQFRTELDDELPVPAPAPAPAPVKAKAKAKGKPTPDTSKPDNAKELSAMLLKGWTMLGIHCPICSTPLMQDKEDVMHCVACNMEVRSGPVPASSTLVPRTTVQTATPSQTKGLGFPTRAALPEQVKKPKPVERKEEELDYGYSGFRINRAPLEEDESYDECEVSKEDEWEKELELEADDGPFEFKNGTSAKTEEEWQKELDLELEADGERYEAASYHSRINKVDDTSKILGDYLLQGWCMMGETCPKPDCSVPLMKSREGALRCVSCGVDITDEDEPTEQASPVPSPTPTAAAGQTEDPTESHMALVDSVSSKLGVYLLQGWCMLDKLCPEPQCSCPLMKSKVGVLRCVACDADLNENGELIRTEAPVKGPVTGPVKTQAKAKAYTSPLLNALEEKAKEKDASHPNDNEEEFSWNKADEDYYQQRRTQVNDSSSKMGEYLLQGWCMLQESCVQGCACPLMKSRDGVVRCVNCNIDYEADMKTPIANNTEATSVEPMTAEGPAKPVNGDAEPQGADLRRKERASAREALLRATKIPDSIYANPRVEVATTAKPVATSSSTGVSNASDGDGPWHKDVELENRYAPVYSSWFHPKTSTPITESDTKSTDHYEMNNNSTNWGTVGFKPPTHTPGGDIVPGLLSSSEDSSSDQSSVNAAEAKRDGLLYHATGVPHVKMKKTMVKRLKRMDLKLKTKKTKLKTEKGSEKTKTKTKKTSKTKKTASVAMASLPPPTAAPVGGIRTARAAIVQKLAWSGRKLTQTSDVAKCAGIANLIKELASTLAVLDSLA